MGYALAPGRALRPYRYSSTKNGALRTSYEATQHRHRHSQRSRCPPTHDAKKRAAYRTRGCTAAVDESAEQPRLLKKEAQEDNSASNELGALLMYEVQSEREKDAGAGFKTTTTLCRSSCVEPDCTLTPETGCGCCMFL